MKKMIIAAFVGIAALAATSVNAQNVVSAESQFKANTTAECCTPGGICNNADEFAGLNLTDNQKTEIKKIQEECRKQCDSDKATAKAAKQTAKDNKVKSRMEKRKAYLAKIKNVLTPEQYVTYLENEFVNSASGRPAGARPDKFRKDVKKAKGNNGNRVAFDAKRESRK